VPRKARGGLPPGDRLAEIAPAAAKPQEDTLMPSVRRGTATRRKAARNRPPLAPASVYAPLGRRRYWWYSYPCRTCGTYHFGRARELDEVTGVRRAGCGHQVNVMLARVYGRAGSGAAA
jgi:hypothetical protein